MRAGSAHDEGSAKKKVKLIGHMKAESLHGRLADSVRSGLLERITALCLETLAALREHMRRKPFVFVAGGFGGLISTVHRVHLVRATQHMQSGSTKLRKVSCDLCNLHAFAAVHGPIPVSLALPPRLSWALAAEEASEVFDRLHARFPGLPIYCEASDAETLRQPIIRRDLPLEHARVVGQ